MKCNNCLWFVNDTKETILYEHEIAKKMGKGFCLLQELFTTIHPDDPICKDFNFDGVNEKCSK